MARAGQAYDQVVGRLAAWWALLLERYRPAALRGLQWARERYRTLPPWCHQAVATGQRLGARGLVLGKQWLLDFPVHPVRTRRPLAAAALAYVALLVLCLVAWQNVMVDVQTKPEQKPWEKEMAEAPDLPTSYDVNPFLLMAGDRGGCRRPDQGMVAIPAGAVILGSDEYDFGAQGNELPRHRAQVAAFEMDRTEVTNEQFYRFLQATGGEMPKAWGGRPPTAAIAWRPAVGVPFAQAEAYAAWVGKRLPTEAEWVRAARGDTLRTYPFGDTERDHVACGWWHMPTIAGSMDDDRSLYGVRDMTGNAAEWTSDVYRTFPGNPQPVLDDTQRVVKGSSYWGAVDEGRCAARVGVPLSGEGKPMGIQRVRSLTH